MPILPQSQHPWSPLRITDDAPRNSPRASRAIAASAAVAEFFKIAASTFSFAYPIGGGIQLGTSAGCRVCCLLLLGSDFTTSSSAMNLATKQCVDKGLWNMASWIAFRRACQIAQIAHSLTTALVSSSCGKVVVISINRQPAPCIRTLDLA